MAMWKAIGVVTLLFSMIFTADLHSTEDQRKISNESPKYVIFDTDMGPDDAWALQMILKSEALLKNVKVLAITTVNGNTKVENVIKNTYRILDGLNRLDIPIYKGAVEAIIPVDEIGPPFFGSNGFSDVKFWKPEYPSDIDAIIQKEAAAKIIRDLVMKYPNQISLVCVAPLTNIALAIKTYPEIKENIREVFLMGGNFKGRGNTNAGAEFNFYMDTDAAYIVLNSLKCPITIVPLEIEDSISFTLNWRFNVLGKSNHTNVQLLNEVEKIAFRNEASYTPHDALLATAYLFGKNAIKTVNKYRASVELQGLQTRGQMVINRSNTSYNVAVVEKMREEEVKKILLWTAED